VTEARNDTLREFIAERFLYDPEAEISVESVLFSTQVIDSFGVMELLLKIEDIYGVRLDIPVLVDAQVDTFGELVELIGDQQAAS